MPDAGIDVRLQQVQGIPLDVALGCAPGELLALVGPSGSGKSTVLRAIAGLFRPRTGAVRCNGSTWLDTGARIDVPPHRRRVGLVFQNYALFPHLTARENVQAAMSGQPRRVQRERAGQLLDLVHLHGLGERYPAQLSGGQQQRVAVARALAREPAVLLLDEPFSAVDKVTRRRLYGELAELRARLEIPTLLVTHDFDEAARLADRICLLDRGRGLQTGTPADVLARPVSVQAARLVDLQNLFEADVVEQREDATVLDWQGRRLLAGPHPGYPVGTRVAWAIPSTQALLQRAAGASGRTDGAPGTRIEGVVDEILALSESTVIAVRVSGADAPRLTLTVPARFARSADLALHATVAVRLLAEGIHLMPAADPADSAAGG
ncbi:MAG: ABC transporter ATP-binding protein [Pseudomonadales bacterium]|nr:ABC transporter ATP-binding protein [Pseudomonadales bacterium]